MIRSPRPSLGFVPSLEVLPLFEAEFQTACPLRLVPHASYGGIARDMLTGQLAGGVIPWEIFNIDVLALPGERTHWQVALFLHSCPTELVLSEAVHRAFHPFKPGTPGKLPGRLVIGVESRNSLTRNQIYDWLARRGSARAPEVMFRMLPMDLMIQGLRAEALDGFVAPSPWGMVAEENGTGKLDPQFNPGNFARKLVVARRRDPAGPTCEPGIIEQLSAARGRLRDRQVFTDACQRMKSSGKPALSPQLLDQADRRYAYMPVAEDAIPDLDKLVNELRHLEACAALPPQVAPNEQTARLLLT